MLGAQRVSIFATDQCPYGNHTADRKSTKVNDIAGMVYWKRVIDPCASTVTVFFSY